MGNPRAFISFDFDNNSAHRLLFVGQSKNSRTPFNIEDWSSKKALPQREWEKLIEDKVNKCNLLIVLVGRKTHTAIGVKKEIDFARSQKVPLFGVYVDGAGSATKLPDGLARSRTVPWDWEKIAHAVKQMMKEGKNV